MRSNNSDAALAQAALEARRYAYAPYSRFLVGAALLAEDGRVFPGCNVENAAYSPTCCAERTALFKAVSEGARSFTTIAIAGGPADAPLPLPLCAPCGVCRQTLLEFAQPEAFRVLLVRSAEDWQCHTLAELLPLGFKL